MNTNNRAPLVDFDTVFKYEMEKAYGTKPVQAKPSQPTLDNKLTLSQLGEESARQRMRLH